MHRVVVGAQALRDDLESMNSYSARIERERDELKAKQATTADLLRAEYERANAAIEREEAADEGARRSGSTPDGWSESATSIVRPRRRPRRSPQAGARL
ncbi:hypothetical protein SMICM17S_07157 [Streptomyces microflavus]